MNVFEQLVAAAGTHDPVIYVDVGAMGGIPMYWRKLGHLCQAIAFEPDEREFAKLQGSSQQLYLPYALAEHSRPLTFYVAKDGGKSSVFKPNMEALSSFPDAARYATVNAVHLGEAKVKAMDEALALHNVRGVDFIKLDTQGSELAILKGAQSTLPEVFGCEIEVEFCELYQGQPLFADVDCFMRGHGFELVDLRRAFWKKAAWGGYIGRGQLVFGDALYFRRAGNFMDRLSGLDPQARLSKIIRAMAVCMVYCLPDQAMDLLNQALAKKFMDAARCHSCAQYVRKEASRWGLPGVWARPTAAKFLNRLAEWVRPSSYLGFSDGDRFIGNTRNI